MVSAFGQDENLWTDEKKASLEGLKVAKEEALVYLRTERNRLLGLSHKAALVELLRSTGLDSRITQIEKLQHGNLLGI